MKRKAQAPLFSPAKRITRAAAISSTSPSRSPSPSTLPAPNTINDIEPPFRFLDLAPELRTEILSLLARDGGKALLKRNSGGIVSTGDPISFVNKQIREEYLGALYQHSFTTIAYVIDFDFRHVVTYYNKLNAAEVKALPTKGGRPATKLSSGFSIPQKRAKPKTLNLAIPAHIKAPDLTATRPILASRRLKILFAFSATCNWRSGYLLRWLNRMESERKIGADARIEYNVAISEGFRDWHGKSTWEHEVRKLPLTVNQLAEVIRMGCEIELASMKKMPTTNMPVTSSCYWW